MNALNYLAGKEKIRHRLIVAPFNKEGFGFVIDDLDSYDKAFLYKLREVCQVALDDCLSFDINFMGTGHIEVTASHSPNKEYDPNVGNYYFFFNKWGKFLTHAFERV